MHPRSSSEAPEVVNEVHELYSPDFGALPDKYFVRSHSKAYSTKWKRTSGSGRTAASSKRSDLTRTPYNDLQSVTGSGQSRYRSYAVPQTFAPPPKPQGARLAWVPIIVIVIVAFIVGGGIGGGVGAVLAGKHSDLST
jgi:hypothetical protein